ncbi:hypothetical protein UFOVP115_116 [uncultured Caudovirales phage]|uniref:Uncharacterized protein n=1 Tax=uncultured Caudovirales phage TaxID=2100421 RepID=A0A6J5L8X3_9CAUD|nr:hypothetical protein UFOVP115_116 [uncultured Caudovirales phage]
MTSNSGNPADSSGQAFVDFVYGNFPVQPNDDRAATITQIGGGSGDYGWSATTKVASDRLNPALDNHANVEAGWAGYPSFVAAEGNYIVTAASGDGTTVTYTSQNRLAAGATVNVTGLTTSAFNLSSATVATANAVSFTVTNSAGSGVSITGQTGKVESTTAASAADGVGLGYIVVPNVLGLATANALDGLKDNGYEAANITTAAAATNAAKTVTDINRTASSHNLVFTASGAGAAYAVGTKVVVSGFANTDAFLNGTYTVTAKATNTFTVYTTATDAVALTGKSGAVIGLADTIKAQSTAAGATGVATNATITITPWAAGS